MSGRLTRHRAGFGFVAADDDGPDLYVHESNQGDALHGDRVRARVIGIKADGRREGLVLEVVDRSSSPILGVLRRRGEDGLFTPFDEGHGFLVSVSAARLRGARDGEVVGVTLLRPPAGRRPAEGRVLERLGRLDEPGMDVQVLIRKYGFAETFPDEVEAEAAGLPEEVPPGAGEGRTDFTGDPVVTIDGATAKDFDDGIGVLPLPGGGWRLAVHIADVSHYVRPGSGLDREACKRGTSVYFPGRALPMLPERLSQGLCSLNPEVPRLVQSVVLHVSPEGQVQRMQLHDGIIRSRARLTYGEVARIVEQREPDSRRARPGLTEHLDRAAACAEALRQRRFARGAIDFDLPEPEILLDLQGMTTEVVARERNEAHRMIEEFMLAANEAVASWLVKRRIPTLFRVHERPDPMRLQALDEVLEAFGMRLPRPFEAIRPEHIQEILRWSEGRPEELYLTRRVLRAMALARYDAESRGHFGLAAVHYLHFTSPIRRYPDLLVHRALRAARRGKRPQAGEREETRENLDHLAQECSRLERDAEAAERESVEMKTLSHLATRLGDEFESVVLEVVPFGLFVALNEVMAEGLVHVSMLGGARYRVDARRHRLVAEGGGGPSFRVGDRLRLRLDRVDPFRRRLDLSPVDLPRGPGTPSRPGKAPSRRRRDAGTRVERREERRRDQDRKRVLSRQGRGEHGSGTTED